jgi:activator of HSP90 ATPase
MAVKEMIARHFGVAQNYAITNIEINKKEIIPKIVKILQRFKCDLCASCCRNAGIDLSLILIRL